MRRKTSSSPVFFPLWFSLRFLYSLTALLRWLRVEIWCGNCFHWSNWMFWWSYLLKTMHSVPGALATCALKYFFSSNMHLLVLSVVRACLTLLCREVGKMVFHSAVTVVPIKQNLRLLQPRPMQRNHYFLCAIHLRSTVYAQEVSKSENMLLFIVDPLVVLKISFLTLLSLVVDLSKPWLLTPTD